MVLSLKIMQQPDSFGFDGEAKQSGELSGQGGDIAQMFRQRLPMLLRQLPAFTILRCVCVVVHSISPKPLSRWRGNSLISEWQAIVVHIFRTSLPQGVGQKRSKGKEN